MLSLLYISFPFRLLYFWTVCLIGLFSCLYVCNTLSYLVYLYKASWYLIGQAPYWLFWTFFSSTWTLGSINSFSWRIGDSIRLSWKHRPSFLSSNRKSHGCGRNDRCLHSPQMSTEPQTKNKVRDWNLNTSFQLTWLRLNVDFVNDFKSGKSKI